MRVGHQFTVPNKYKDTTTINVGGYKIIIAEEGVLLQGARLLNLHDLLIGIIGIIPLDEDAQRNIKDFPFEIERHHLIYQVSFNNYAWYFNNKEDAYKVLDLMLQTKEMALHKKFIKDCND